MPQNTGTKADAIVVLLQALSKEMVYHASLTTNFIPDSGSILKLGIFNDLTIYDP